MPPLGRSLSYVVFKMSMYAMYFRFFPHRASVANNIKTMKAVLRLAHV